MQDTGARITRPPLAPTIEWGEKEQKISGALEFNFEICGVVIGYTAIAK